MKRMLLLGCLITILAFGCFGCSGGSKDAHAETISESAPYKPISIRMFDIYGVTEGGQIFFQPNTKAWVTDEDEQSFLVGDNLRYGGKYGMDGMIDAPIIICKPINYYHSVEVVTEADYGVAPEQITVPPTDQLPVEQRVDIRVYSPMGKLLWFFPAYISYNDLEIFKSGGNLRFRSTGEGWSPQGTYLLKAPIITITEDVLIGPILWKDDGPQGDSIEE